MRIAFVIVPNFVFRAHTLPGGPLHGCRPEEIERAAIVEGEGGRGRVIAAAPVLLEEGVRNGMTVARARSKIGFIWTVSHVPSLVTHQNAALAGTLLSASPQVQISGSGVFWVGANGFRLLGGEDTLVQLLDDLIESTGYEPPRIGIADTVIAARAAAIHRLGVIPPGQDSSAMAGLPLSVLPLDEQARDSLWALGIRTVGAFSVLPTSQLSARFGKSAERARRLALGDDPRGVPLLDQCEDPTIEVDFEAPFDVVEPALFVLRGGMDALVAPHRARGFGIYRLRLELVLTKGSWVREVRPPEPITNPDRLVEMCHGLMQDAELPASMQGVRVSILEVGPASARQEGLWEGGRRRRPIAIDVTLMRLQSRLGPNAVRTPGENRDEHLPDYMAHWDTLDPHTAPRPGLAANALAAWRLKRPPLAVDVRLRDGLPCGVQMENQWSSIGLAAGPQRIESRWWDVSLEPEEGANVPPGIRRDYWYAQLEDGPALSLYCDLQRNDWYLQAVLD